MSVDVDWTVIEQDYRAGVLSQSAICAKYNISIEQLKSKVSKYRWERVPLDPLAIQAAHGVISSPSPPKFGMDSHLNELDLRDMAVITAASVISIHRKDVYRLREVAARVSCSIVDFVDAVNSGDTESEMFKRACMIMGKDSPADMLVKLSNVMTKLVGIERQAFGLDILPPDPAAGESTATIQTEMSNIWTKMKEIQAVKNQASLNREV